MAETVALGLVQAIERAAAQLADDPAIAGEQAHAILTRAPGDPRALLILASARRRLGDFTAAHAVLAPLAAAYPRAARTQYELGLASAGLGQRAAAIAALRKATALSRDLAEAWRALGDLLFAEGEVDAAEAAFDEHRLALIKDAALRPAAEALIAGRLTEAEQRLHQLLSARPNDATALHLLGQTLLRRDRFGAAQVALARSLAIDPTHDGVRFSYATALFRQQKAAEALPLLEQLMARDGADAAYRNLLAGCLALLGEDARALALYEGLLADYDRQPQVWLNYGHALRAVGRGAEAVAAYRRCLALGPGFTDAYLGLANLKVAAFTPDEVAVMTALAARKELSDDHRLQLHFALGKALEDAGDHAAAFENYAAGGRMRRAQTPYDPDAHTAQLLRAQAVFTRSLFEDRADCGEPSDAPIFIVGLPRSGSTLIEQMLASHSAVEGTMELPDIGQIAAGFGAGYPERLIGLTDADLTGLGKTYLDTTRAHRKLDRPRFIDKMPNNFAHIGLIQLILPKAVIIDARRHPLATGFSAFKQHFAQGQAFSYDLTDLGRYYRDYVALMAHFDAVLPPGRVLRVIYEDLVEDTEAQVRRLLSHCRLEFESACLSFHQTDRAVRTVSSEQVRRPIFRDGLEQWRHFEPWLDPLKAALGPSVESWRR